MLSISDLYDVFMVKPKYDGTVEHQLAGRLMIHDGSLSVLTDYFGHLRFPEGPMNEHTLAAVSALRRSGYFKVTKVAAPRSDSSIAGREDNDRDPRGP